MTVKRAAVKWAVILVAAMSLASCSAQWHLKRAIAKDPKIAQDTLVRIDTVVVVEEVLLGDTLVVTDTVTRFIENEKVLIKLQRIKDTIRVQAKCKSDTIVVVKEVEVPQVIQEEKKSIFDSALGRATNLLILFLVLFGVLTIVKHSKAT